MILLDFIEILPFCAWFSHRGDITRYVLVNTWNIQNEYQLFPIWNTFLKLTNYLSLLDLQSLVDLCTLPESIGKRRPHK